MAMKDSWRGESDTLASSDAGSGDVVDARGLASNISQSVMSLQVIHCKFCLSNHIMSANTPQPGLISGHAKLASGIAQVRFPSSSLGA